MTLVAAELRADNCSLNCSAIQTWWYPEAATQSKKKSAELQLKHLSMIFE